MITYKYRAQDENGKAIPGTMQATDELDLNKPCNDMYIITSQFFCQHFFQVFLIFYFFCSFSTLYNGALIFHSLQSFAKTFAGYHHFCELVSHE